jgi:hypothetical protein
MATRGKSSAARQVRQGRRKPATVISDRAARCRAAHPIADRVVPECAPFVEVTRNVEPHDLGRRREPHRVREFDLGLPILQRHGWHCPEEAGDRTNHKAIQPPPMKSGGVGEITTTSAGRA